MQVFLIIHQYIFHLYMKDKQEYFLLTSQKLVLFLVALLDCDMKGKKAILYEFLKHAAALSLLQMNQILP